MRPEGPTQTPIERFTVPLHPPLFATFFVLFLFVSNAVELIEVAPLWIPLAIAVVGALVTLVLSRFVLGDWLRGGLLASWLLILFFTFGYAWILATGSGVHREWLLAVYVVVGALGAWAIVRARGWVRPTTRLLNVVAALLVVFNSASLVLYATGGPGISPRTTQVVSLGDTTVKPDIYYIVLDRYANSETLRKVYGYDNSAFLAELRVRGFAIADDAWGNHFKTALSLSSSMNMDYLQADHLPTDHPASTGVVYSLVRGHRAVPDTLTAAGYTYVHIGNYWEPTATNVDADQALRFSEQSTFWQAVYQTSALSLLSPPTISGDIETLDFPVLARDHAIYAFDQLEAAAADVGPTYVFAHILVPHTPYVFNADGSFPSTQEVGSRGDKVSYVEQLKYTNTRVLQAIDHLLDVPADQKPVIVLMADEGPFPDRYAADQAHFNWLEATPLEVQQKFGILNALYLPGGRDPADYGFTNRTSPVNEFRIVFNAIFDANLPILPDLTYLSPDQAHLYDFVLYPR